MTVIFFIFSANLINKQKNRQIITPVFNFNIYSVYLISLNCNPIITSIVPLEYRRMSDTVKS